MGGERFEKIGEGKVDASSLLRWSVGGWMTDQDLGMWQARRSIGIGLRGRRSVCMEVFCRVPERTRRSRTRLGHIEFHRSISAPPFITDSPPSPSKKRHTLFLFTRIESLHLRRTRCQRTDGGAQKTTQSHHTAADATTKTCVRLRVCARERESVRACGGTRHTHADC